MNINLIPEKVKKYRSMKGWTQKDLADHSHVNLGIIGKLESGVSLPRYEALLAIVDALEISLDELFGRKKYVMPEMTVSIEEQLHPYASEKLKLLENIDELKDQAIKRLEREVITYKTHIERQEKMLALQQRQIDEMLQKH